MASPTGGSNVYLLDYGAGNVLSVANAVKAVGGELKLIKEAADFDKVSVSIMCVITTPILFISPHVV